jgi:hypothetical protein
MRITDISAGKASLESLLEKRKTMKGTDSGVSEDSAAEKSDATDLRSKDNADQLRVRDLEKSYLRNNVSLQGLEDLQKVVHNFEQKPEGQRDFNQLSQELKQSVTSVKFDGENVISYLSTQVKDDKSLYALKSTLAGELDSLRQSATEERRQIASFLVKSENIDAVTGFAPEKTAADLAKQLDRNGAENLFRGLSNIANLIGSDR